GGIQPTKLHVGRSGSYKPRRGLASPKEFLPARTPRTPLIQRKAQKLRSFFWAPLHTPNG
ncbi:MAG: hypothetical protein N2200_02850, partial [Bacteroidia bacterium]|nr:hypothetical protein [Bacteroidia bacterium]